VVAPDTIAHSAIVSVSGAAGQTVCAFA